MDFKNSQRTPRYTPDSPELPRQNFSSPSRRPASRRKKPLVVSVLIIALLAIGGGWAYLHHTRPSASSSAGSSISATKSNQSDGNGKTIRILAAGDFIAHDSINANAKQADGSYDYMPMMNDFTKIFQASDIRFCNDANLNGGTQFGVSGYPKFNSPTEFARDMGRVGCNMVNTGTNHSFDKTQDVISASVDAWQKIPNTLAVAGQNRNQSEHDTVHYFTTKGVKFAFLAYTTYLNQDAPAQNGYGVNVFSRDFAGKQITQAKAEGAQFIITSIRWGTEYSPDVNSDQKTTAQWLSDQGVNLVLGHGSHVLQPVQQLAGSSGTKTTVFYSLGNFLNTQEPPETLFNGLSVITVDTASKQITSLAFLPIYMHYEWTAAQSKSEDLLKRHNLKMYLLDDVNQAMIDANQLHTTIAAQRERLTTTLNTYTKVPLITLSQYLHQ